MKVPSIGADPEFSFKSKGGRMIHADSIIQRNTGHEYFGTDGCSAIAEIRPLPAKEPRQLVDNIRSVLQVGLSDYPALRDVYWKAGSCTGNEYALGGHIHFGTRGLNVKGIAPVVKHLDTYVAQIISLLEDENESSNRRYGDYGGLNDYRTNDHGFEWRTPSSWLTSPRVAEGVLCLSHACVVDSINGRMKRLPERLSLPYDDDWNEIVREDQKRKVPGLKKAIKKFRLYKKYQEPIEFIFKLINENKTWFPKGDMKEAWGLVPKKEHRLDRLQIVNVKAIWDGVSK